MYITFLYSFVIFFFIQDERPDVFTDCVRHMWYLVSEYGFQ